MQERIVRIVDIAKTVVHYGWYVCVFASFAAFSYTFRVPFVIYVGFMSSSPRPNLLRYVQATHTHQDSEPTILKCHDPLGPGVAYTGSYSGYHS